MLDGGELHWNLTAMPVATTSTIPLPAVIIRGRNAGFAISANRHFDFSLLLWHSAEQRERGWVQTNLLNSIETTFAPRHPLSVVVMASQF
jgi:hypothetical protein